MMVTVKVGPSLPGRDGVRVDDLVVVTEAGCRFVTGALREFRALEV
jgi:Xaa-Pro aminopeptidase